MHRIDLPSRPDAPSRGVRALDAWLDAFDESFADRVRLAAGEALGNAVEHGPGLSISVEWAVTPTGGRLCIHDGSRLTADAFRDARLPPREATAGRGLFILDALSDRVTIGGDGTLCLEFDT